MEIEEIRKLLNYTLSKFVESAIYPWDNMIKVNNMHEALDYMNKELIDAKVNFKKFTVEELEYINFRKIGNIVLIPLIFYKVIPVGTKLTTIMGNTITFTKKTDNDNRGGLLAYGFLIDELKK